MEVLELKGNELNPTIYLNHLESKFIISGESRPENPKKYYESVFKWFEDYFRYLFVLNDLANTKTSKILVLTIDLDYFNSTSAKVLFDLFTLLKTVGKDEYRILFEVDWVYHPEDSDMLDAGKEIEALCGISFNYKTKV
jgi:hypothetical protein